MPNTTFYDNLAIDKVSTRRSVHSISFYISALFVAVVTTGGLVIFGLSAFNRIEPASNTTVIFHQPNLPIISNGSAKSSKNAMTDESEKRP